MKHLLCLLLAAFFSLAAFAQKEQDFASRYMDLYGEKDGLECITVSPLMMQQLMRPTFIGENKDLKEVLSQIKSIQMLKCQSSQESPSLYKKAIKLVEENHERYQKYSEGKVQKIYVRRRGKTIVEMILFVDIEKMFLLIDLTGEMNEDFLDHVKK